MYNRFDDNRLQHLEDFANGLTEFNFLNCKIPFRVSQKLGENIIHGVESYVQFSFYQTYIKFIELKMAFDKEKLEALAQAEEQQKKEMAKLYPDMHKED